MVKMMAVIVLTLGLFGCDAFKPAKAETSQIDVRMKVEAESLKAQAAFQDRLMGVQMKVIETCQKLGKIPVLIGGNVDCK